MKTLPKTALVFAGSGVAGFLGEYALAGQPRSAIGRRWPFLPTYAVGGALVSLAEPSLRGMPWWQRAAVYGVGLSGVELAACKSERRQELGLPRVYDVEARPRMGRLRYADGTDRSKILRRRKRTCLRS